MAVAFGRIAYAEQRVEDSGVSQVGFGAFDEAFAHVFEPGWKEAHHEGSREDVGVVADGLVGEAEGSGYLGGVPGVGVVVSEHGPEPAHLLGRYANPDAL